MQIQSLPIIKKLPVRAGKRQRQAGQAGRRAISSEYLEEKKIAYVLYLILTFLKKSPNKTRTTPANAAGYSQIVCQS